MTDKSPKTRELDAFVLVQLRTASQSGSTAHASAPAACERALYDIVRRLQEDFEYRADLGRPSDGNDDATGEQDHNHAIRAGGIRPGAGHAAQAGGRRPISPSGGSANESLVCDL